MNIINSKPQTMKKMNKNKGWITVRKSTHFIKALSADLNDTVSLDCNLHAVLNVIKEFVAE